MTDASLRSDTVGGKVTRASVATSASQLAVLAFVFATSIAQARLLGPEGRGELARFANAGALVVLVFGLGINSAITYFLATGAARPRALLRSLAPTFVVTVLAVAVCSWLVLGTPLRRLLPESLPDAWVVVSLTAFFAFSQAAAWLTATLAARGVFFPINASAVLVAAIAAVVSAGLVWLQPEWADAAAIIALVVALEAFRVLLLAVYAMRRDWSERPGDRAVGRREEGLTLWQLLRYSALTYVADTLQVLSYRLDMWIVDAYHGASALGVYALAVSLAQLVWVVPTATARVLFPYTAMVDGRGSAALAWRGAQWTLVISAGSGIAGWIASELFLTTLFGEEFHEVPTLIGILLLGIVPFSIAKVIGTYFAGTNAVGLNALSTALILVVGVGLYLLLIPSTGTYGAAWATAITYILHTLVLIAFFARRTSLPLSAMVSWRGAGKSAPAEGARDSPSDAADG